MHDPENPAHLVYTSENGNVVRSVTVIRVDARTTMVVVFQDDGDRILNPNTENPLYFATPEAAMQHIDSLAQQK